MQRETTHTSCWFFFFFFFVCFFFFFFAVAGPVGSSRAVLDRFDFQKSGSAQIFFRALFRKKWWTPGLPVRVADDV